MTQRKEESTARHVTAGSDYVGGNKYAAGNIDTSAVALGENARATLNYYTQIIVRADSIEDLPPAPGEPPYKGLAYFTEKDKDIYFGREALSDQLVGRLQRAHFLALIGASGSGKSSLLRAGIIPRLRERNWRIRVMKPGAQPLMALAATLTSDAELPAAKALKQALADDPDTLSLAAAQLVAQADADRLLLAVDQFEELFTQSAHPTERQAFVDSLVRAAQACGAVTVLVSMRADFYGRVSDFPELTRLVSQMQEYVTPMESEDLVRVIAEPMQRNGGRLQKGLVEQIITDVGREPGRLPLLSHALLETWKRRSGVHMTLWGYHEAGTVSGAIRNLADEAMASLKSDEDRKIVRGLLQRLVYVGDNIKPTRRRVFRDELDLSAYGSDKIESVIDCLLDYRLVVKGWSASNEEDDITHAHGGRVYLELIHEALIEEWPKLADWLREDQEIQRLLRPLMEASQRWERKGRDPSYLYSGTLLADATDRIPQDRLNSRELGFLKESQQVERGDKRRRTLLLSIVALAVVLIGFIAFSTLLDRYRLERDRVEARGNPVEIAGGEAILGNGDDEVVVTIQPFSIQRFEVSVEKYCLCERHGACRLPEDKGGAFCESDTESNRLELPMTEVSAQQALDFCRWIEGGLPSWVQWERAARGPHGQLWPWGDSPPTPHRVNAEFMQSSGSKSAVEVDSSKFSSGMVNHGNENGIYHMVGNVWEWTSTDRECGKYSCASLWNGGSTADLYLAGGAYDSLIRDTVTESISRLYDRGAHDIGFRCVFLN